MRRLRHLGVGARALGAAGLALAVGSVSGCGPVEYVNQVPRRAARAVADAKQAGGERHAPYEYTAAVEYLHKAREEGGYAEYQVAIEYGRRAEDLATKARAIAEEKGGPGTADGGAPPEPPAAAKDSP